MIESSPLPAAIPSQPVRSPRGWTVLAWVVLAVVVLTQIPAFLSMGLDSDICMYDVVARRVMRGDVHYRDLLETNFPGIVWLHLSVRSLFGWRSEVLRAADLTCLLALVWLLVGWLPRPAPTWQRATLAVVLVGYYLTTNEWCHWQRDTLMLLPALVALNLRFWQVDRLASPESARSALVGWAFLEGVAWAVAFWIKPFVAVPGLICWLMSARQAWRSHGVVRRLGFDLAGFLTGGLVIGAAGIAWLVTTGAWPAFLEVMFQWNHEYFTHNTIGDQPWLNLLGFLVRSFPWILIHLIALPLAVMAVLWSDSSEVPPLLAAFYLGWLGQTILLQHLFDYVHVPPILLGLTVVGIAGFSRTREDRAWLLLAMPAVFLGLVCPRLMIKRTAAWTECVRQGSTPAMRDRLAILERVCSKDMEQVAAFLRAQQVGDGEVTSFSLPTVLLYNELDLRPSTRYLFLQDHLDIFVSRRSRILADLAESKQRFLVCDLSRYRMQRMRAFLDAPKDSPSTYPWLERVVFRAGNYVVFRVDGQEMPAWLETHFGPAPKQ